MIGGRGTGKSTILEYLRWAVADEHPKSSEDDDTPNYRIRSRKLIKGTLRPVQGIVDVEFNINGISHIVRRSSDNGEFSLKIGDAGFEICSENDVRSLVPIQAYSQKQLSNVGVRLEELSNFVHAPIRDKLSDIANRFERLVSEIRQQYALVNRKRTLERMLAMDELSLVSLESRTNSIRDSLTGLSKDDRKYLERKPYFDQANLTVENWEDEIETTRQHLQQIHRSVESVPSNYDVESSGFLTETVREISDEISRLFNQIRADIKQAERRIAEFKLPGSSYDNIRSAFRREVELFDGMYNQAQARSSAHESQLNELKDLEQKQGTLRKSITKNKNELSSLGHPEKKYHELRVHWLENHNERFKLVEQECQRLTRRSGHDIKATLIKGTGLTGVMEELRNFLTGSKLRRAKLDSLLSSVAQAKDPVARWEEILAELEILASTPPAAESEDSLPETPLLLQCDLTTQDIRRIRDYLSIESWISLALMDVKDQPNFQYRKRDDDYIEFDAASAGQQATALLKTLLDQPGPPLIIDQPEDDLDNPVILEIVEQIWSSKAKRQLVFASHNANLVVNGDAELVACCDHVVAGDRSGGAIKQEGAIDIPEICEAIKRVMEGGEIAFKLRSDKYGF